MNYTKPEITSLASASKVIQSQIKNVTPTHDSSQEAYLTSSAYEADE
jgi:hypothetical protein